MSTSSTTSAVRPQGEGAALVRRPAVTLLVIATCYLMVTLDTTVVNVALPSIQSGLHFSRTGLAWVLNGYMLTFGGLLLLGGRAGDILGRRRVLVAGVTAFCVASLLGGLATSAGWLLAARAAQGVGGAFITPSALALIASNFAEGAERNRALSVYAAVAGSGASIGLILGGILTDWASWRWALFLNVPVGIAVVLLAPRVIQEPERNPGRFDLAGALTGTLGTGSLVCGFIRAASDGWGDGVTRRALALAVVLLGAFVTVEIRAEQPILPLHLFADRNRASAYLNILLIPATMFAVFFFLTQYLQDVLGYSPFTAGVAFLPLALPMLVTVRVLPRLLPRFGPKRIMVTGAALLAAACLWLTQVSATSGYVGGLLGPMLLFGVGAAASILPLNVVILSGVSRAEAGAASGLLQTMQWVGGSLGLAVLVTVFGSAGGATIPSGASAATVHRVFTHGMTSAFATGTVLILLAFAVATTAVRPPAQAAVAR